MEASTYTYGGGRRLGKVTEACQAVELALNERGTRTLIVITDVRLHSHWYDAIGDLSPMAVVVCISPYVAQRYLELSKRDDPVLFELNRTARPVVDRVMAAIKNSGRQFFILGDEPKQNQDPQLISMLNTFRD